MKKFTYGVIVVGLFIVGAYILSLSLSTSKGQYYTSVSSYQKEAGIPFYNFYAPDYYFNKSHKKVTLAELNKVKIYYQGTAKNSYNMSFEELGEGKDISVNYRVSQYKENEIQTDLKDYLILNEDSKIIYYTMNESFVSIIYYLENKAEVGINIKYNHNEEKEMIKDKAIQILLDSIKLNT